MRCIKLIYKEVLLLEITTDRIEWRFVVVVKIYNLLLGKRVHFLNKKDYFLKIRSH